MAARMRPSPKPNVKVASSHEDWRTLMTQAIAQAEKVGDRRAGGMRLALSTGNFQAHLRKLGIICPQDILREFPDKG